jgi:hypothetical protein
VDHSLVAVLLRLAAVVCLVSAAAFAANASMKTLTRTTDPVTVPGHKLRLLHGNKIDRLGLFVFDGKALRPIPFQIDERRDGQYVYTHGEIASTDTDDGALDADDELAFICADAGPRLQPFLLPSGVRPVWNWRLSIRATAGAPTCICWRSPDPRRAATSIMYGITSKPTRSKRRTT